MPSPLSSSSSLLWSVEESDECEEEADIEPGWLMAESLPLSASGMCKEEGGWNTVLGSSPEDIRNSGVWPEEESMTSRPGEISLGCNSGMISVRELQLELELFWFWSTSESLPLSSEKQTGILFHLHSLKGHHTNLVIENQRTCILIIYAASRPKRCS